MSLLNNHTPAYILRILTKEKDRRILGEDSDINYF